MAHRAVQRAEANRQADLLGTTQGKKFYDKFAAYNPKSAAAGQSGGLPGLDELLHRTAPEGEATSAQPTLDEILKGLEATAPKPAVEIPPAKPGTETPKPGTETPKPTTETPSARKSQPAVPELPKIDPVKTEPGKTEATKPEPGTSEPGQK